MTPPKGTYLFFVGIGGAGMSALAAWLHGQGYAVAGYDRIQGPLCRHLEDLGIPVIYDNQNEEVPEAWNHADCWCIYTPAIAKNNPLLAHFERLGAPMKKRAVLLAECLAPFKVLAVAGTHGKTTTSCMLAWLMDQTIGQTSAVLGGVSANFDRNYLSTDKATFAVTEADEFDRSFLQLHPWISVLTSMDADHLDIYGDDQEIHKAFQQFALQTRPDGLLIARHDLSIPPLEAKIRRYGIERGYYAATKLKSEKGRMRFDLSIDGKKARRIYLPMLGIHNVENATAALAVGMEANAKLQDLAEALEAFKGVGRRMHLRFQSPRMVYIDDYAHHPQELEAVISSVRAAYPDRFVTGIFQPHLFSRTRDFADGFRESLAKLDALWLMDIYPAREEPIEGINSTWLLEGVSLKHKMMVQPEEVLEALEHKLVEPGVLLSLGAGDIDRLTRPITDWLNKEKL